MSKVMAVMAATLAAVLLRPSLATADSWSNQDVGSVGAAGSSTQTTNSDGTVTATVKGSGADIWGTLDEFQFDYQSLTGDGTITARVVSETPTDPWAKAGVMIRETLSPSSTHALVAVTSAHGVAFQRRETTGAQSVHTYGPLVAAPYWVRLTRSGNTFSAYSSPDGTTWTLVGTDTISMAATVFVGLAVTSHQDGALNTAMFDHVAAAPPGGGWSSQDVGSVGAAGSSTQTTNSDGTVTATVKGSGADIWGTLDEFQFDYQSLTGDGTITARVVSETPTDPWAKAGVMIRETLSPSSTHALVAVTSAHGVAFQRRETTGAQSVHTYGPLVAAPYWVRLTRSGNTFSAYSSPDGTTWTLVGTDTISMAATVFVGLAVTSHQDGALNTAMFDHVAAAPPGGGWSSQDVGSVGAAGSSTQTTNSDGTVTATVKGSGADIWGTVDEFQFDYQSLTGDGTITARVVSLTPTDPWAKAGVMIRETLSPSSTHALVAVTSANGVAFQRRKTTGGQSVHTYGPLVAAPYWVRLTRSGNTFSAYASLDGITWTFVGQDTISMAATVFIGLAVTSHHAGTLSTAPFDHVAVGSPGPPPACSNPLDFGAAGDGVTDDTAAIQSAVDTCAAQPGGGTVQLGASSKSIYLTGPLQLKSHVSLQIDQGIVLQGTNDHSRYAGAYINWVYDPKEALISAAGATDVAIVGLGTIDGAGGQLQPDGVGESWWTLATLEHPPCDHDNRCRPYLLEFYQCDHVTISGVTLRNAPMWYQAFRFSQNITESAVTVTLTLTAPNIKAPNTDGVDVVGSTGVSLSGLHIINVADDAIAIKSGLTRDTTDPKQNGLPPPMAASNIQISDITVTGARGGIVIGSEAVNGVNNVSIRNLTMSGTSWGFWLRSGRDRGGDIYGITVDAGADRGFTMSGVARPIILSDYFMAVPNQIDAPIEPPIQLAPLPPLPSTTPYVHDITIQNLTATGAYEQSVIEGLPEACFHNVTLTDVRIQTVNQPQYKGIELRHMTGTFTNVTSVPGAPNDPFVVDENVAVATAGTTPTIEIHDPFTGQVACSANVAPSR